MIVIIMGLASHIGMTPKIGIYPDSLGGLKLLLFSPKNPCMIKPRDFWTMEVWPFSMYSRWISKALPALFRTQFVCSLLEHWAFLSGWWPSVVNLSNPGRRQLAIDFCFKPLRKFEVIIPTEVIVQPLKTIIHLGAGSWVNLGLR